MRHDSRQDGPAPLGYQSSARATGRRRADRCRLRRPAGATRPAQADAPLPTAARASAYRAIYGVRRADRSTYGLVGPPGAAATWSTCSSRPWPASRWHVGYVWLLATELRTDPDCTGRTGVRRPRDQQRRDRWLLVLGAVVARLLASWNSAIRQGRTGYTLGKTVIGIRLVTRGDRQPLGAGSELRAPARARSSTAWSATSAGSGRCGTPGARRSPTRSWHTVLAVQPQEQPQRADPRLQHALRRMSTILITGASLRARRRDGPPVRRPGPRPGALRAAYRTARGAARRDPGRAPRPAGRGPRARRERRRRRSSRSSATFRDDLGRLDRVVVNAGLGKGAPLGTGRYDANRETAMTNFVAALAQAEAAMEIFRDQDARPPGDGLVDVRDARHAQVVTTYAATKAGVAHLGRGPAHELLGKPDQGHRALPAATSPRR